MEKPVVFLDKDGTLVQDVPYNTDPRQIILLPGTVNGLRLLYDAGYRFVIVSNQSGVARGYFSEQDLRGVEEHLRALLLTQAGVPLERFYYCPHHPQGSVARYAVECACRKPLPGMLFTAARELGISLPSAWMVGDILNDVEAGKRAGCRAVLIDNGGETEWIPGSLRTPDFTAANLEEAARMILTHAREGTIL